MMNVSYERDMFNKSQRLVLGLLVLILVDVIWVSCTQLKKVSGSLLFNPDLFQIT